MTVKEKKQLAEILDVLETAKSHALTSAYRYSDDVHARSAFQVGYLQGRITQAVRDLTELINN